MSQDGVESGDCAIPIFLLHRKKISEAITCF